MLSVVKLSDEHLSLLEQGQSFEVVVARVLSNIQLIVLLFGLAIESARLNA